MGAFSKIVLVKKKKHFHTVTHNDNATATLLNPNSKTKVTTTTANPKTKRNPLKELLSCSCLFMDGKNHALEQQQQQQPSIKFYALKKIDTSRVDIKYMDALRNEIAIFKSLDHPNIIKAYETFEYRRELSIIMELATGGDLYTRRPYKEPQSQRIVKQVVSAIAYMHHRNIMHRDLKFENIMYENKKANAEIKVIDFGLSTKFLNPTHIMRDKVGTLTTVAPEVIRGSYTVKADMWSIGVVAYMLLTGQDDLCPGTSKQDIERKILNFRWMEFYEKINHDDTLFVGISTEGKDFLQGLLEHHPSKRLSADEALRHPWLTTAKSPTITSTTDKELTTTDVKPTTQSIRTAVQEYVHASELKKLALQLMAYQSPHTEQMKKLRRAFSIFDVDQSGEITLDDFQTAFRQSNDELSDKDIKQLFEQCDFKKEKCIDYTEFIAATMESQGRIEESRIAEAFERLDPDNSGKISRETICEILSHSESDEYISSLLEEADFDGDGMVNYDDFRSLFVEKKKDDIRNITCNSD